MEGVHTSNENGISMHTAPGCDISGSDQTATLQTTNCDVRVDQNSGCGSKLVESTIPNNFGADFNENGGGVYATEWTSEFVKHWFFPRGSIPSSITNGAPDVSQFGKPTVNQQGPGCVIDNFFTNMSIIINTDFCGDWAGNVYFLYPECPQQPNRQSWPACVDYVGNNPQDFVDAYWSINSIRVYQQPINAQPSASYSTSLSPTQPQPSTNTINGGMGRSTNSASSLPYTGPLSSLTATETSAYTAVPTPLICPSSNDTIWTDSNGQDYTIACGSDFTGGFAGLPNNGVVGARSFANCLEICDQYSACVGVAFVGGNGAGTCYIKSDEDGKFVYDGTTNGARKGASPSMSSSVPTNIASTSSADEEVESSTTSSTSSDAPSTTIASESSTRIDESTTMTSVFESPTPSSTLACPGINNQVLTARDDRKFRIYCSSDADGSSAFDVAYFAEGDFTQCLDLCTAESECTTITWVQGTITGGTCYLKKEQHNVIPGSEDLITAILVADEGSTSSLVVSAASSSSSSSRSDISSASQGETQTFAYVTPSMSDDDTSTADIPTSSSVSLATSHSRTATMEIDDESSTISASMSSVSSTESMQSAGSTEDTSSTSTSISQSSTTSSAQSAGPSTGTTPSASSPSSPSTRSSSSSLSLSSTTSTVSANASPTNEGQPACNSRFTDPLGEVYIINCATDSSTASFLTVPVPRGGFSYCFGVCDTTIGCQGFTFVGGNEGDCYLKSSPGTLYPAGNTITTCFKIAALGYSVTSREPIPIKTSRSQSSIGTSGSSGSLSSTNTSTMSTTLRSGTSSGGASSALSSTMSTISRPGSSSSQTSGTSSGPSSTISYGPAPPCPTSTSYYCMGDNPPQTTCSTGGTNYAVQCGILYEGTEIDTSDINIAFGRSDSVETEHGEEISMLVDRATVPDFASCQNLCSITSGCKAFNFVGYDCTLFSSVSGYSYAPGVVGGVVYGQNEAPPTPIDTLPSCPDSAGKSFTDSMGIQYEIVCYTQYSGGYIPIAPLSADNIANCLPTCDMNDLCVAVEYDTLQSVCRFKSANNGTQTVDNNIIAAVRAVSPPGYSDSTSAPPMTVTTTITPTTTICKSQQPSGFHRISHANNTSFICYIDYHSFLVEFRRGSDKYSGNHTTNKWRIPHQRPQWSLLRLPNTIWGCDADTKLRRRIAMF